MSSKLRNRLLALACLAAFIGLGFVYFRVWVVPRTFGVILVVGDGLTMDQLVAARLYSVGTTKPLAMERLPYLALVHNYSEDYAVPDTAAAVSALATGVRVRNYTSAITTAGRNLDSLLRRARRAGRSTGIVTTGPLAGGGVAPFYASTGDLGDFEDISAQLLQTRLVDVLLGGGAAEFQPDSKGGKRQDGRDLLLELARNNYTLVRTKQDLQQASGWPSPRVAGFFADGPLDYHSVIEQSSVQPSLSEMVQSAIQLLQNDRDGYFLVVHVGSISNAAANNDAENAILETIEMDHTMAAIAAYAGDNATVIACGLHGIGGMKVNGYPFTWQKGADLLGINSFGVPSLTWSTGPSPPYTATTGTKPDGEGPKNLSALAPAAFPMAQAVHTVEDVIAVGSGPGAERLHGFLRMTDIHAILRDQL